MSAEGREYDYVIDASEGRLTADSFALTAVHDGKEIWVNVLAIGIGIDPQAYLIEGAVLVLANCSAWVLEIGASTFHEIAIGYPVITGEDTDVGFLVYHHLGCVMLSKDRWRPVWRFLGGVLEDFSRVGSTITLNFDEGRKLVDLVTGTERRL